jgi:hypothetical protein
VCKPWVRALLLPGERTGCGPAAVHPTPHPAPDRRRLARHYRPRPCAAAQAVQTDFAPTAGLHFFDCAFCALPCAQSGSAYAPRRRDQLDHGKPIGELPAAALRSSPPIVVVDTRRAGHAPRVFVEESYKHCKIPESGLSRGGWAFPFLCGGNTTRASQKFGRIFDLHANHYLR